MKNEIIQMILCAVGGTGGMTGIVIAIINARTKLQLAKISAENGIQIEDRKFKCGAPDPLPTSATSEEEKAVV